jgi:hypothetical protein
MNHFLHKKLPFCENEDTETGLAVQDALLRYCGAIPNRNVTG